MVLEQLGLHMQIMNLVPFFTLYMEIHSKQIIDLNDRTKTIKLV